MGSIHRPAQRSRQSQQRPKRLEAWPPFIRPRLASCPAAPAAGFRPRPHRKRKHRKDKRRKSKKPGISAGFFVEYKSAIKQL